MAARYVHQLAEEVLSMLSGIASEVQVQQDISKIAKHRFEEWDKNFPAVLKEIGGPDDIANFIMEKEGELKRLQLELDAERADKDKDLENVMRSMDYQLHASRNGALSERQQLTHEFKTMAAKLESDMRLNNTKQKLEISKLHDHYEAEISKLHQHYQVLFNGMLVHIITVMLFDRLKSNN